MIPESATIAIPSSRGPRAQRPHQLQATLHRDADAVAHLPVPANARVVLPLVLPLEEPAPPSSNGPAALRPTDLATVLDRLR